MLMLILTIVIGGVLFLIVLREIQMLMSRW